MSTSAAALDSDHEARAQMVLERCDDDVLWTIAPPGIVLHNFRRRIFLELDGLGYSIWAYLDGGRSVREAVELAVAGTRPDSTERAFVIVNMLHDHGFVMERRA